jgi:hypothetical protein
MEFLLRAEHTSRGSGERARRAAVEAAATPFEMEGHAGYRPFSARRVPSVDRRVPFEFGIL